MRCTRRRASGCASFRSDWRRRIPERYGQKRTKRTKRTKRFYQQRQLRAVLRLSVLRLSVLRLSVLRLPVVSLQIVLHRPPNLLHRDLALLPPQDLDLLSLERLVRLEEVLDFPEDVLGDVGDVEEFF